MKLIRVIQSKIVKKDNKYKDLTLLIIESNYLWDSILLGTV